LSFGAKLEWEGVGSSFWYREQLSFVAWQRQPISKKYEFSRVTDQHLQLVENLLNNRPRKTLGYRTPNEVFFKQRSVALPT